MQKLTKTFHWFFTDIIESSNPLVFTKEQAQKVMMFNKLISQNGIFKSFRKRKDLIQFTGDGIVIGFSDSPEKPLLLAMELHQQLKKYNKNKKTEKKILIRTGIHSGPVYVFKNIFKKDTFWGQGIIIAKRIMDFGDSMHILGSESIIKDLRKIIPEYEKSVHPLGYYSTKHGEQLPIYNIFGKNWGNKKEPVKNPREISKLPKQIIIPNLEIDLRIKNPKNMMMHNTWILDVVNVYDKSIQHIPFSIFTDLATKFRELNVSITDRQRKKLLIDSITKNEPFRKDFIIKLNNRLPPDKKKQIKLDYDIKNPSREFFYVFSTDCKKFIFKMIAPKNFELGSKLFKFDPIIGNKILTSSTPKTTFFHNRTEITWEVNNIRVYEGYKLEW